MKQKTFYLKTVDAIIMNEVDLGIRGEIDNRCYNSQRMIDMMSHRIKIQIAIDLFDLEEFDWFQ